MIIAPKTSFKVISTNVTDNHKSIEMQPRSNQANLHIYNNNLTISNPNYGSDYTSPVYYNNPDDCSFGDIWYIITNDGYAIAKHGPYNGQSSALFQIIENHGVVDCDQSNNIRYVPIGTYIRTGEEFQLSDGIYIFTNKNAKVFIENKVYEVGDVIAKYDTSAHKLMVYKKIADNSYMAPETGSKKIEENAYLGTENYSGYVKWEQDVSTSAQKLYRIGLGDEKTSDNTNYTEYCNLVDWDGVTIPEVTTDNTDNDLVVRTYGGTTYYINMTKASEYQGSKPRNKFFYNQLNSKYFAEITRDEIVFKTGSLNKDLPFDTALNTQAIQETSISYTLKLHEPSDIVTFGNIVGDSVSVTFRKPDGSVDSTASRTIDNTIDDSGYYKQGTTIIIGNEQSGNTLSTLPVDSTIEISITGSDCRVGRIETGKGIDIGIALLDFSPSIKDYSPMEIGKGGEVDYAPGVAVYNIKSKVLFSSDNADKFMRLMKFIKKSPISVSFSGDIDATPDIEQGIFAELQMLAYISSITITPKLNRAKDSYSDFFEANITFTELG